MQSDHRRPARDGRDAEGRPDGRARAAVALAALLAGVFVAGAFAIPWLEARGYAGAAPMRLLYAPLCHQIDSRTVHVDTWAVAVCARCTGLYVGGLAGLILAALLVVGRGWDPRPLWFFLAIAPSVIDVLLPRIGLPGLPNLPRLGLALPAGLVAGLFLSIGIYDLFKSTKTIRSRESGGRSAVAEEWDG